MTPAIRCATALRLYVGALRDHSTAGFVSRVADAFATARVALELLVRELDGAGRAQKAAYLDGEAARLDRGEMATRDLEALVVWCEGLASEAEATVEVVSHG